MSAETTTQRQERIEPQLDWVLLRKIDHEDKTASGIIIPELGDIDRIHLLSDAAKRDKLREGTTAGPAKHRSVSTSRYLVLAVGPGDFTDFDDAHENRVFLRKPLQTRVGDTVLAREGVREIFVNSETLYLCQDFSALARIHDSGGPGEYFEPLHDYIFAAPAKHVAMSKGGIQTVHDEDWTGNQRFGDERYTALGVGEGAWCLHHKKGQPAAFARRPLPVQTGDTFCAHGVGFSVSVKGAVMTCLQAFQVAGVFRQAPALSVVQ